LNNGEFILNKDLLARIAIRAELCYEGIQKFSGKSNIPGKKMKGKVDYGSCITETSLNFIFKAIIP
jgi:hypothetical protein